MTATPTSTRPVAVITGASRGLGRAIALHLAAAGVDIVGTYHQREDEAASLRVAVEAAGARAVTAQLDVTSVPALVAFAGGLGDLLEANFRRRTFDSLINNAGHGVHAAFADTTLEQLEGLFAAHLRAPYVLTQRLLPLIADGGRIVNVSSGLARFTGPGFSAYASMKGGVEVLTRYLARELGPRGITVNAIAPGAIETDFGGGVVRDNAAMNAAIASATALGRAGRPDDVGAAVAALLTPGCAWITGQRIEISGGQNI